MSRDSAYPGGGISSICSVSNVCGHRVSSSLLGSVVPSFRALPGRLRCTVRRHKFNTRAPPCRGCRGQPPALSVGSNRLFQFARELAGIQKRVANQSNHEKRVARIAGSPSSGRGFWRCGLSSCSRFSRQRFSFSSNLRGAEVRVSVNLISPITEARSNAEQREAPPSKDVGDVALTGFREHGSRLRCCVSDCIMFFFFLYDSHGQS